MSMTREQVLAEMEASFSEMTPEEQTAILFTEGDKGWSPALLLEEVRNNTETGQQYVENWSQNKESNAMLDQLLAQLLDGALTCGDPNCPNCKGEVRPFNQLDAGPDSEPTIH